MVNVSRSGPTVHAYPKVADDLRDLPWDLRPEAIALMAGLRYDPLKGLPVPSNGMGRFP